MTRTMPATHASLFYDGARQYATESGGFLREGLERGHRGLVMAPSQRVDQLRAALGRDADEVTFVEDTVAYAPQWNVYRVLLDFAAKAPGVRTCAVAEQALSDRGAAEVVDYRRLEAAINLVFAEHDVDLLCPYDAGSLPTHLLEIGLRSHGEMRADGGVSGRPADGERAFGMGSTRRATPVRPLPETFRKACNQELLFNYEECLVLWRDRGGGGQQPRHC